MATTVQDPKHGSPKRKRVPSVLEPPNAAQPGLHLFSQSSPDEVNATTGSPSSAVTTKLEGLRLKGAAAQIDFAKSSTSEPGQKRMRPSTSTINTTPNPKLKDAEAFASIGDTAYEIPETPLCPAAVEYRSRDGAPPKPPSKRMKSPPPPTHAPRSPNHQSAPNLLTWQESEITGYDIDGPDDDGEGINGLGFKPTPAMAYARSQERKRQVREWRAREAKEARQKRSERRRRGESEEHGGLHECLSRTPQQDKRAKTVTFAENGGRSTP